MQSYCTTLCLHGKGRAPCCRSYWRPASHPPSNATQTPSKTTLVQARHSQRARTQRWAFHKRQRYRQTCFHAQEVSLQQLEGASCQLHTAAKRLVVLVHCMKLAAEHSCHRRRLRDHVAHRRCTRVSIAVGQSALDTVCPLPRHPRHARRAA
jgi:hypothetical protein